MKNNKTEYTQIMDIRITNIYTDDKKVLTAEKIKKMLKVDDVNIKSDKKFLIER